MNKVTQKESPFQIDLSSPHPLSRKARSYQPEGQEWLNDKDRERDGPTVRIDTYVTNKQQKSMLVEARWLVPSSTKCSYTTQSELMESTDIHLQQ